MSNFDRRSLLRSIMILAGAAAVPQGAYAALFDGPETLPSETAELLAAVADTMIPQTDTPGALGAGVPGAFDRLLANWASPVRRTELTGALQAIDARSLADKGSAFAALSPEARFELLDAHDRANAENADYAKLKELIVALYYLSEIGSTVELRYEHVPGAWEPSIPVTAETRNYGGPSLL